jgi:hypothetical protein
MIKSRMMKWSGRVASMREKRKGYRASQEVKRLRGKAETHLHLLATLFMPGSTPAPPNIFFVMVLNYPLVRNFAERM